jgi:Mrp family chromosome partitioning ATPase
MQRAPVTASDHIQPLLRLLRRTLRFWWLALIVLAVGVAGTWAAARYLPRKYRSEAVLYYREGLQWNPTEGSGSRRMGQRLKDLLLSRTQLTRVIEELGLYPKLVSAGRMAEAVEEMQLATTFRASEGDIFVVSFTGDSPQEARRVTARLTEILVGENTRMRSGQAEVAKSFLETEKRRTAAELAAKEAEYIRFLAKHPEFVPPPDPRGGVGASLRPRVATGPAEPDVTALRREEQRLRRLLEAPAQGGAVPRDADPVAARDEAETRLKAAQQDLAERRARYTEEHPDVRAAVATVRQAEDAYRRALEASKAAAVPVPPTELEEQLAQVQRDIAEMERRRPPPAPAAGSGPEARPAHQRAVALETEWAQLSREVAEARERFQQIDSKQFGASMTLSTLTSGQAGQIVVVDPAFEPAKPLGMSRTRIFIAGIALSFLSGLGLAMLFGVLDDRLHERDDVDRLGLAPVLVEVPPLGDGRRARARRKAGQGKGTSGPERRNLPRNPGAAGGPPARGWGATVPQLTNGVASVESGDGTLHGALAVVSAPAEGASDQALAVSDPAAAASSGDRPATLVRSLRVEAKPTADPRLHMLQAPAGPAAASFRVLRHRLTERLATGSVLVTSPGAGEGKTLCAVSLALALGEAWQARPLLLEADFRRPVLARLLGFAPPVCIAKQLGFFRSVAVHYWEVAEMVAPALHAAAMEAEGGTDQDLDGPSLGAFIEDLRRTGYDHVVIDGPPVLGSADANLIEERVDGVLLVLRAGRSRGREFRRAVEQLASRKLLGVVWLAS